ncbi:conserved hypothetical protein [Ricinus communis]|uniref:Uncharacterized protein n=1 Tax=Ricinus communis TaxID=3988 RepID=B9RHG7_RICCO|nr:conserved hypothetical protein [Ricinus communis]
MKAQSHDTQNQIPFEQSKLQPTVRVRGRKGKSGIQNYSRHSQPQQDQEPTNEGAPLNATPIFVSEDRQHASRDANDQIGYRRIWCIYKLYRECGNQYM